MPSDVGIRELRQNLSVYLRRVREGERFVVTDRREPVAELGPIDEHEDAFGAWLRRNSLSAPTGDLRDLPPPLPPVAPGQPTASELLQRERDLYQG